MWVFFFSDSIAASNMGSEAAVERGETGEETEIRTLQFFSVALGDFLQMDQETVQVNYYLRTNELDDN